MQALLKRLKSDYPDTSFVEAGVFSWSRQEGRVYFTKNTDNGAWSLLHEAGHMLEQHTTYDSDIGLIRMEIDAWQAAKVLAKRYDHTIDEEHIEQCLDSYRDWLHLRSKCTICSQTGLEQSSGHYGCINCGHQWKVGHDRFCRIYRKKIEPPLTEVLSTV